MKKTLLITKQSSKALYTFLVFCLFLNFGWSQTNLVLNSTCDEHTVSTSDNADAWDMTPPSSIDEGTDNSPYKALWNNTTLETYLKDTYNSGSDVDEQPGSSSDGTYDGATKTRSVKLYDDGDPVLTVTASTRRLYQKITVEEGVEYTFKIDSRSEAENIPSEVFILNEEITTEAGLENGATDSRVDAYLQITNDYNSSKGSETTNTFTTNTFNFTATTTTAVIYVRAPLAISGTTEVFYDNIELYASVTASLEDNELAKSITIYPNPVASNLKISGIDQIQSVVVFNVVGKEVLAKSTLENNLLDMSSLNRGVYFVKITNNEGSAVKRVIKE